MDANAPPAPGPDELRVRTLGSGTLLPSATRRSASHLVEFHDVRILLDIGFGTMHGFAEHGVDWPGITHVVVSHFHTDHIGDLAPLLFGLTYGLVESPRTTPLKLVGPPGFGRALAGLAIAHGDWVTEPPFPLDVVEVKRRDEVEEAGFRLVCHPVTHTPEAVAWRIETDLGVVGYTGDTGPDPEAARFLAGSDILVCECALPEGSDVAIHLTPSQVADLAGIARPDLLVLTHCYPPLDPERAPHLVRAAGYEGSVTAARDGAAYLVRQGRVQPSPTGGV